ncbi:DNA polymerase III, chi subunit [Loktanella fryxellensis]|uniref:DNA polymerase III, chi subunit n=1 Tax=Loktanella fryxellensis TaxID=245187 RepID=A0A1H8F522_9RHOB|nr:DNA polymerase III subunit chi [Loktanella fryxellensis]SEN26883.1 DNA polymerase III, chi subunit [Loktanella fryxellensis]
MGAVYFYHLTDSPLEAVLPMLLDRARGQGWRVLVRGRGAALLDRLDQALWDGTEDGFRPHGLAGGPHDADQPILLGADVPADGFACMMAVDGAEVTSAEAAALERTCILFDGQDGDAVARARVQWKAMTANAILAQYWAQENGAWVKKAETPTP